MAPLARAANIPAKLWRKLGHISNGIDYVGASKIFDHHAVSNTLLLTLT